MADSSKIYHPPEDPAAPPPDPTSEVGRVTAALDSIEARLIQEVTDLFDKLGAKADGVKGRLDDIVSNVRSKIDEIANRR